MHDKTKARLIAWAEEEVKQSPTRVLSSRWDSEQKACVSVTGSNTVELELADLLVRHCYRSYEEYKRGELVETIAELLANGTKGYNQMTREELFEAFDHELLDYYENIGVLEEREMSLFPGEDPIGEALLADDWLFDRENADVEVVDNEHT